eukprot:CAMPEP_0174840546 /NCGR_PEP_ID=MMETSP1114-20130205/8751_1 /TAXON_ID=312471 /ORGANISM="Neobodo designis, Strain CCAP 1951/1" /LENGTH=92 /DNA_ID=CAMNT_0016074701 /DNA_START=137 /DNA_END=412 /DNA_ORIENTATION=-
MSTKRDHTFKLLLIGDSGVGISCLVMRFVQAAYVHTDTVIASDIAGKLVEQDGKNIMLSVWDSTHNKERFRTAKSWYYRGAQGIIIVYDITD